MSDDNRGPDATHFDSSGIDPRSDPAFVGRIGLAALFVTALVTSQLTAAKLLGFSLPVSLPITGDLLVLPGAALAYAVTFFASDCYAELYGRRETQVVVNVAFAMNFVLLVLVWSTAVAPTGPNSPVSDAQFEAVVLPGVAVVLGSLSAYVVSQNWDVLAFHRIREYTDGDHLWARNVGSTASSQAIDTVIFVSVAFVLAPALGVGSGVPPGVAVQLMVGQYLLKLLVAVADTPFVYAVVGGLRSLEEREPAAPAAD